MYQISWIVGLRLGCSVLIRVRRRVHVSRLVAANMKWRPGQSLALKRDTCIGRVKNYDIFAGLRLALAKLSGWTL